MFGGQWKEKKKVLMLKSQWKEKEKVLMFGGQWKEKEKVFFHLFPLPHKQLYLDLRLFFINIKVLFYHGFKPLFTHFFPFPWPINYDCTF